MSPVRRRHSRLRWAWSAYPASMASPAMPSAPRRPVAVAPAWASARNPWNRNVRWRTLGPTPTACRQRRRSWLVERARWPGQGVDVHRVPGHQCLHGRADQRIRADARRNCCRRSACRKGAPARASRSGHRLDEAVHRTAPELAQAQPLVHQVVEHRRKGWRGPGMETHAHDGGVRRDDLDLRTGQRTDQLGMAADRKVDLDAARGQVPLHVCRRTGALDPDRPHHAGQSRQRRTLDVGLHCGHPRTGARASQGPRSRGLRPNRDHVVHRSIVDSRRHQTPPVPLPVLVVGGGPAGVVAALELARRSVGVRIVDQAARRAADAAQGAPGCCTGRERRPVGSASVGCSSSATPCMLSRRRAGRS